MQRAVGSVFEAAARQAPDAATAALFAAPTRTQTAGMFGLMCSGTIVQFGIPRVVIGDTRNLSGNEDFLRASGVEVTIIEDDDCYELMKRFIAERTELWWEDIGRTA